MGLFRESTVYLDLSKSDETHKSLTTAILNWATETYPFWKSTLSWPDYIREMKAAAQFQFVNWNKPNSTSTYQRDLLNEAVKLTALGYKISFDIQ